MPNPTRCTTTGAPGARELRTQPSAQTPSRWPLAAIAWGLLEPAACRGVESRGATHGDAPTSPPTVTMTAPDTTEASDATDATIVSVPPDATAPAPRLPLELVADVPLPGGATRFDYQDIDRARGRLVIAHMNDGSLLFVELATGSVLAELGHIATARGVVVAGDVELTFVTSSPHALVVIDDETLTEVRRVTTGSGPDGVAWDGPHRIVGVSDQGDGALSLIADAGAGVRKQVALGAETGNVVFDAPRGWFWITVVRAHPPDALIAVDPLSAKIMTTIDLPGCDGAHGLRIHPDGGSALVACEGNDRLVRVALDGDHALTTSATGRGADVLSIDPDLGWIYVAAESGDLTVFDIAAPGLTLVGHDHPGANAHTVAVDPTTHRVYFPLPKGAAGKPVLRIMRPSEIE
ncbi:MAG: hypothetical protein U1F43_25050 [Myxococcota bacterium]